MSICCECDEMLSELRARVKATEAQAEVLATDVLSLSASLREGIKDRQTLEAQRDALRALLQDVRSATVPGDWVQMPVSWVNRVHAALGEP